MPKKKNFNGSTIDMKQMMAIHEAGRRMLRETEPKRLIEKVCACLTGTGVYPKAWIVLTDTQGERVLETASSGFDGAFNTVEKKLKQGEFLWCMRKSLDQGDVLVIHDPETGCADCPLSRECAKHTTMIRTLRHKGTVYGTLFVSTREDPPYDEDHQRIFSDLTDDLAMVLNKIHIIDESRLLKNVLETIPHLVAFVSPDYRYQAISDIYAEVYGVPKTHVLGHTPADFLGEKFFKTHIKPHMDDCLEGNYVHFEMQINYPGKGLHWMEAEYFPYRDETSEVKGIILHAVDATQRKQEEERLKESEERLNLALKGADLGLWDWDIQSGELRFNDRWTGMLGYTPAEIKPHASEWERRIHPDDASFVMESLQAHLEGKTSSYETVHRLKAKDGEWKWILDRGKVLAWDAQGKPLRAAGTHLDITDKKHMVEALQQQQQQLRAIFDTSPEAMVLLGPDGLVLDVNKTHAEQFWTTPEQMIGKYVWDFLPESVRSIRRERVEQVFSTGQRVFGEDERDGVYNRYSISPVTKNSKGQVESVIVSALDITERKRLENQLGENNAQKQALLDGTPDLILLLKEDLTIEWANRAALEMNSKSVGQACYKAFPGKDKACKDCPALRTKETGQIVRSITHHAALPHFPDESYWEAFSVPVIDDKGNINKIIEVSRNVTNRIKAENDLKHALGSAHRREEEMRALLKGAHAVMKHRRFQDTVKVLFDICREQIGADVGFVSLVSGENAAPEYIIRENGRGFCNVDPARFMGFHGFYEKVLRTGGAVYENDFGNSQWVSRLPGGHILVDNVLFSPVKDNGKIVAILGLANKPGEFNENDLRVVYGFGELASISFRNSNTLDALNELTEKLEERVQNRTASLNETNKRLEAARDELQESQGRFVSFMDHLPAVAFIKDLQSKYIYWNKFTEDLFDVDQSGFGKTAQEKAPDGILDALLADDRRVIQSGLLISECNISDSKGKNRIVECHKFLIQRPDKPDLIGGVGIDITEKQTFELLFKKHQKMLQTVFDGIPEPLILMDLNLTPKLINRTGLKYFGFTNKSALRRAHQKSAITKNLLRDVSIKEILFNNEYSMFERKSPVDPERIERVYFYPLFEENNEASDIIVGIHDATEELKLQAEMMQSEKIFSLGNLVAGMAHEINNPNNFIMMNTPMLQELWTGLISFLDKHEDVVGEINIAGLNSTEIKEEVPALFEGVLEGTRRINSIVNELKDYAAKEDKPVYGAIDVNDPLKKAIALVQHLIKQKTSSFEVKYGQNMPKITGNIQRLEQVFVNLVQNALEALPDRHRKVLVESYFDEKRNEVIIAVRDEGIGIPEKDLQRIRDPFFTTKRQSGGTGLGLAICDKIINLHGGTIEVQSEVGQGSIFKVILPTSHSTKEEGAKT